MPGNPERPSSFARRIFHSGGDWGGEEGAGLPRAGKSSLSPFLVLQEKLKMSPFSNSCLKFLSLAANRVATVCYLKEIPRINGGSIEENRNVITNSSLGI